MSDPVHILFVGELHSSHAQSWIQLLASSGDAFAVQGVSLAGMPARTDFFIRRGGPPASSLAMRCVRRLLRQYYKTWAAPIRSVYAYGQPEVEFCGLVKSLRQFNPHIVHTFGFTPAALIYACLPERLRKGRRWVLQTRGGSDVAYTHTDPAWQELFRRILPQADVVLCDNLENYRIFQDLGITVKRPANIRLVPGTGGVSLADFAPQLPWGERENLLVWNKAYESPWSKALPVLEGLRLAWNKLDNPDCVFTAADQEVRNHVALLPEHIRSRISLHGRIPRDTLLRLMGRARVSLSPSLVDGIPNTLYEAMAAGCIPVVSPLPTITPHFTEGENVLYARNLYPDEIAAAIIKAFDKNACQGMQNRNLEKVRAMADRSVIAEKMIRLYKELALSIK